VGLLVVGVVAGTTALWIDFDRRVEEATAQAAEQTVSPPSLTASASPTERPAVVSLWIGDGYTAGSGADRPQTGESCVAAHALGWDCVLDAERGTGFLSDGHAFDPSYDTVGGRLDDLPAAEPDVVVVDAGRNDVGVYSPAAIVAAMDDYLARLRAAYPDATLVQVVPWRLSQEAPDRAMTRAVTTLMDRYDGYLVDPVAQGWAGVGETDRPALLAEDGVSNQSGHDLIGAELAASLRALDLPVGGTGPTPDTSQG